MKLFFMTGRANVRIELVQRVSPELYIDHRSTGKNKGT